MADTPGPETRALYFSYEVPFLKELAAAFIADRTVAVYKKQSTDFVDGRLALIDEVLAAKGRLDAVVKGDDNG